MLNCCITGIVIFYFVDTSVTGSFTSGLYVVVRLAIIPLAVMNSYKLLLSMKRVFRKGIGIRFNF